MRQDEEDHRGAKGQQKGRAHLQIPPGKSWQAVPPLLLLPYLLFLPFFSFLFNYSFTLFYYFDMLVWN